MSTWLIIVIAVLLLLALGGAVARARQLSRTRGQFERSLDRVNHDLAEAAASDRGWDRERLESAARRILAEDSPGGEPAELLLVEVIDHPGTDQDQAVFRVRTGGADRRLTLGRRDGEWVRESLA